MNTNKPMASKADLVADLEATMQELELHTKPKFESAVQSGLFTSGYKLQNPWTQKRLRIYGANVRGSRGQFIEHISKMLGVSMKWLGLIVKAIEDDAGDEVHLDGITYPKKTLLDLYSAAKFHVRYSRKLLLITYSFESSDPDTNTVGKPNFPYSRAEVMDIEYNFASYCRVSNLLDKHQRDDLLKIVGNIPDILVDTDAGVAVATYGANKLMPMTHGITEIGSIPNPIWHIRKWFASLQSDRFKAAEAEAKMLDLRLIKMRREAEGTDDIQLDKSIEYQTARLAELNYKIAQLESKYGL